MTSDSDNQFPLGNFLGMEITGVEAGRATARVAVASDLMNPHGFVHGGVLFTMVDTAMGKAAMSVLREGQRCATIEVQLRFLRAVAEGSLIAEASVIRPGRSVMHLESRVHDGDGTLVATGSGTFAVISMEPA